MFIRARLLLELAELGLLSPTPAPYHGCVSGRQTSEDVSHEGLDVPVVDTTTTV